MRVLDTTGRVIRDPAGQPVRMAGVCIDVTERWEDQQAAERNAERFRLLVETAPLALLVVDPAGTVLQVNARATALFGAPATDLVDQHVTALLPDGLPVLHADESPAADVRDRAARRVDGTGFPADVTVGATAGGLAVVFVRDATDRLREEEERQRDQAAALRRVQALEINDNVLQGLSAAIYTLEQGDADGALQMARATLGSARSLVADLLGAPVVDQDVEPGALVRGGPAPRVREARPDDVGRPPRRRPGPDERCRVVIADDAEDLRFIFGLALDATDDFRVVGTAADGREALEVCGRERPDLVLLDLSMPVMDGLEVLPRLLRGPARRGRRGAVRVRRCPCPRAGPRPRGGRLRREGHAAGRGARSPARARGTHRPRLTRAGRERGPGDVGSVAMSAPAPSTRTTMVDAPTDEHPLRRLWRYAGGHRRAIVFAGAFSVLNKLFDLAPPFLIGAAVDIVVEQGDSWVADVFGVADLRDAAGRARRWSAPACGSSSRCSSTSTTSPGGTWPRPSSTRRGSTPTPTCRTSSSPTSRTGPPAG